MALWLGILLALPLLVIGICVLDKAWYHPLLFRGKKLPPGSMGWPYIGETLQLYSQNPNVFFTSKQKRYGDIFKSHILGCPCVMITDPEAAKFILVNKSHLFKPTFPASKERLLGRNALFFHQGEYHLRMRKLVQNSVRPQDIRNIIPEIEKIALQALKSWEGKTIVTYQEIRKYALEVGIHTIFGETDTYYKKDLNKYYDILKEGYNSFPINLPGTLFKKSLKARMKLNEVFKKIVEERKKRLSEKKTYRDMLDSLMASIDESGKPLTDDQILDNVVGVLFAAQDTTASALTWILKYLTDHPHILTQVTAEQDAIKHALGDREFLTWSDIKKMDLTYKVIQETLRMASIISFTFREAVEDVEYKGYVIPKGWKVMPLFRIIHHNPEFYDDPQNFDPSRFEKPPKPNTFIPFGNGVHSCPGNELAKAEMLVFIHHLTTKYRWDVVGTESGIQYGPFPVPKEGLPLKIRERGSSSSPCSSSLSYLAEDEPEKMSSCH